MNSTRPTQRSFLMKTALLIVCMFLLASGSALAAGNKRVLPQRVAPTVSYPWSNDVCSGFSIDSTGQVVCKHGPAWGSPVYGCPKGYTMMLLLSNKLVCVR
jgi:hypothetical protein